MKNLKTKIAIALISTSILGGGLIAKAGSKHHHKSENIASLQAAPIQINKAVEIALAAISGTVKEAEFEIEDGQSIWEVELVNADKEMYELEIDANSGEILKQKRDHH